MVDRVRDNPISTKRVEEKNMFRSTVPFVQCACGAGYSRDEWSALPRVAGGERMAPHIDVRACRSCLSYLSAVGEVAPQPRLPMSATGEQERASLSILLKDPTLLRERVPGPEGVAYYMTGFRYLLRFGIACVVEDKYPPLTRCWKDLERLFLGDEEFDDGLFLTSWILMDFPFGPKRETALDYFESFFAGTPAGSQLQPFVDEARRSRLGLHQVAGPGEGDLRTSGTLHRKGHCSLLLSSRARKGGDPAGTNHGPRRSGLCVLHPEELSEEAKTQLEDRVLSQLFYFDNDGETSFARYEGFMKLAGPYWMSCVTKNADVPFLAPDHYRTYLDRGP